MAGTPLHVGVFPGPQAAALLHARDTGLFAEAGVDGEIEMVRSSTQQMDSWDSGRFQIVHTAPDHFLKGPRSHAGVFARRESIGELVVVRCASATTDTAKWTFGVDAAGSAFALVMCAIVEESLGFSPPASSMLACGGTLQRTEALRKGTVDAATVHPPFDAILESEGFAVVGGHFSLFPEMCVGVCVVDETLAGSEAIRGYLDALDRSYAQLAADGALLAAALELAGVPPDFSRAAADRLVGPYGLGVDPEVTRESLEPILSLRERFDAGWVRDEVLIERLLAVPEPASRTGVNR